MRQVLALLWAISISMIFSAVGEAGGQDHKFRLQLTKRHYLKPSSQIRVRVFPHTKRYKPHGRDDVKHKATLTSSKSCSVYEGRENFPGRTKVKLGEKLFSLDLDAKKMTKPIYLKCNAPITIVRSSKNPHFTYKGDMYARVVNRSGAKTLEIINIVSLKNYLKGVVPSEVYSAWPMETLNTQAVAARTYAVFHINFARRYMRKKRVWDVGDTIVYQAYTGISLTTKRTNMAVNATEGQILTHNGAVIQAYYHADSGGQTEAAANVWDLEIPYVQGRKESFDFEVASSSWKKTVSLRSIESRLRQRGLIKRKQKLVGLSVPGTGRTDSGRVKKVSLDLLNGESTEVSILKFKKLAGNLPSTLFAFERHHRDPRYFVIKGLGSGHGVGMSQQGAAILADQKGWKYNTILDYYYTDTTLCRLHKKGRNLPDCYSNALKVSKKKSLQKKSKTST